MFRTNLGKKAAIKPTDWFYMILFVIVFAFLCIFVIYSVDSIIGGRLRTYNFPYYELDLRLLNHMSVSSDIAESGLINLNNFNEAKLIDLIDRNYFPDEYQHKIGLKLVLKYLDSGEESTIYYDKEFYEDATPIAGLRKYAWIKNIHPVRVYNGDDEPMPASLRIEIIGKQT